MRDFINNPHCFSPIILPNLFLKAVVVITVMAPTATSPPNLARLDNLSLRIVLLPVKNNVNDSTYNSSHHTYLCKALSCNKCIHAKYNIFCFIPFYTFLYFFIYFILFYILWQLHLLSKKYNLTALANLVTIIKKWHQAEA